VGSAVVELRGLCVVLHCTAALFLPAMPLLCFATPYLIYLNPSINFVILDTNALVLFILILQSLQSSDCCQWDNLNKFTRTTTGGTISNNYCTIYSAMKASVRHIDTSTPPRTRSSFSRRSVPLLLTPASRCPASRCPHSRCPASRCPTARYPARSARTAVCRYSRRSTHHAKKSSTTDSSSSAAATDRPISCHCHRHRHRRS
jgi:hypothetical protein